MKYRLELNNISKSFGDVHANKNINLQVKKGEIQALLGENGAGKSTLVKMIYGILAPDKGEIYWNNWSQKARYPHDFCIFHFWLLSKKFRNHHR